MSNEQVSNEAIAPNAKRLLAAGFMAILAAGVGFALRGGIFDNWAKEFGFTGAQLGAIGGAGLSGFCFGIIIGGLVCDKLGYGKLVLLAFALHVLSAVVTQPSPDISYHPRSCRALLPQLRAIRDAYVFQAATVEAIAR